MKTTIENTTVKRPQNKKMIFEMSESGLLYELMVWWMIDLLGTDIALSIECDPARSSASCRTEIASIDNVRSIPESYTHDTDNT